MKIILKHEYKFIHDGMNSFIFNMFTEKKFELKFKEIINIIELENCLHYGITVDKLKKDSYSNSSLIIRILYKTYKELFIVTEDKREIRKIINCRNIIMVGLEMRCPKEKLENYIESYEKTKIIVLGDISESLLDLLKSNGLNVCEEQTFANNTRNIVVYNQNVIDEIENFSNVCYIPYSIKDMTLGPCYFNRKVSSIEYESYIKNSLVPSYSNMLSLYSILLNCILFIIGEIYQTLYFDVGLPIQRKFILHIPSIELKAISVYNAVY